MSIYYLLPDWQNECERWSTLAEATAGHEEMVKRCLEHALDHATAAEDDESESEASL